jgi:hypothetical protein
MRDCGPARQAILRSMGTTSSSLERLDLASSAIHALTAIGAIDSAAHVYVVVRKAGRRPRDFFSPRTRILNYSSWIGGYA